MRGPGPPVIEMTSVGLDVDVSVTISIMIANSYLFPFRPRSSSSNGVQIEPNGLAALEREAGRRITTGWSAPVVGKTGFMGGLQSKYNVEQGSVVIAAIQLHIQ